MMAFITHCWRKVRARLELALLLGALLLGAGGWGVARAEVVVAEVPQLVVERSQDGILLTALVNFELPLAVEDALLKGVPVIFVAGADVYRDRWYWLDKKLASVERHMRLVFHPLTRRWRLAVGTEPITNNGLGVVLNQTFDSLEDALSVIRRISGWRIADVSALEAGSKHRVEFRFRLDVSQLPRPLQIGAFGQSEWSLSATAVAPFQPENFK
jgi:hypothetical protein